MGRELGGEGGGGGGGVEGGGGECITPQRRTRNARRSRTYTGTREMTRISEWRVRQDNLQ